MKPDIVVLGSLNMDLVVETPRRPAPGETVMGTDLKLVPGGKGANQAVAAARLGGRVAMAGRIGDDAFGQTLLQSLQAAGVETKYIIKTHGISTGTAVIILEQNAQNSIVVVPGANGRCSVTDVEDISHLIGSAKILMVQLEIPLETVQFAVSLAKERGVTVILDPAPARELPDELLRNADIITPNETEAHTLTGKQIPDVESARSAALDLMRRGSKTVLIKLGRRGVLVAREKEFVHIDGFPVEAVDTTAAGDAFGGGLAVALVEGGDIHTAARFANAAGALACTKFGAQTSMPTREEVEAFLKKTKALGN